MSALMIRDYLVSGMKQNPIAYAANYYLHMPIVGIGHWPPFFYVVLSTWMLAFGIARAHVLLLIALITAVTSFAIYLATRKWVGNLGAVLLGAMFQLIPIVRWSNDVIMSDILVSLLILWAALAFGKFLNTERTVHALSFGVLAGIALLTKPEAGCLALLPLPAILLSGKYRSLSRPALWIAGLITAVMTVPWYIATRHLVFYGVISMTASQSCKYATIGMLRETNIFLALFAIGVYSHFRSRTRDGIRTVLILLPFTVLVTLVLSHVEVEDRHLIPAILPIIITSAYGIQWLAAMVTGFRLSAWKVAVVTLVVVAANLGIARQRFGLVVPDKGIGAVSAQVDSAGGNPSAVVLVTAPSSSAEGRLIAEAAENMTVRPSVTILRATKLFAKSDWNGDDYVCLISTPEQVIQELDQDGVSLIALDTSERWHHWWPHETVVLAAIQRYPARFRQIYSDPDSGYAIYRFSPKHGPTMPKVLLDGLERKLDFNPFSRSKNFSQK